MFGGWAITSMPTKRRTADRPPRASGRHAALPSPSFPRKRESRGMPDPVRVRQPRLLPVVVKKKRRIKKRRLALF